MAYKTSFRPLGRPGRDGGRRLDDPEMPAADERGPPPLGIQPRRILVDA